MRVPDRRNEVDVLIAAAAHIHGLTVGTRNVKDFKGACVIVVDPRLGGFRSVRLNWIFSNKSAPLVAPIL
ncbi:hypothetical protein [Pararhizobium sp. PWRC1-1]|uniref:hypothetical protein n=1 Tax=Pararhizobium sp. PWRC1-1 TaxID=2804566 RepID=UPI003CE67F31